MYDKVPAAVEVPRVKILDDVVFIFPAVIVSVPLTDTGILKFTPPELELLTVMLVRLAVEEAVRLRKVPDPEIVCETGL
ncbi:MAG: hypothetical protein ACKO7B_15840, partial [Flavobacteriales bacterium]